jgi:branched-chain amino acid aminotransferase
MGETRMQTYYVDGKFVPADRAVIPVDDLAILRGIGVFDLLRTYAGRILFLKEHIDRLFNSARQINLEIPWPEEHIRQVVVDTLSRNDLEEANIRIVVTGGSSPDFMTPAGRPRLIVLVSPLPKLPEWWYRKGVKVIVSRVKRATPGAKTINYAATVSVLQQAKAQGAVEVIYLDGDGNAVEGATSNLFAVFDQTLVTPGRGILSGITRKAILEIASECCQVDVRDIPLPELLKADEVFITGTNKGLVPVVQINDTVIGNGIPGPLSLKISEALQKYTEHALK